MSSNNKAILAVDAGGTYYKAALVSFEGVIHEGSFIEIPSCSTQSRSKVLAQLKVVLNLMGEKAKEKGLVITRIRFDVPGPFDYIKCCSLMKHKFLSIQNLPLKPIIQEITSIKDINFHSDLHASAMGAFLFDEAKGFKSVYCIGIGTGLGTGFIRDSKIVSYNHGQPKYPIFQKKVGDNILEDFVSNRGIVDQYRKKVDYDGVLDAKIVEDFARGGDKAALLVYEEMGEILGSSIKDLLTELRVDCVVFSGQISKGFKYFGPAFIKAVEEIPHLKKVSPVKDFNSLALRGVCFLPPEK